MRACPLPLRSQLKAPRRPYQHLLPSPRWGTWAHALSEPLPKVRDARLPLATRADESATIVGKLMPRPQQLSEPSLAVRGPFALLRPPCKSTVLAPLLASSARLGNDVLLDGYQPPHDALRSGIVTSKSLRRAMVDLQLVVLGLGFGLAFVSFLGSPRFENI